MLRSVSVAVLVEVLLVVCGHYCLLLGAGVGFSVLNSTRGPIVGFDG